MKRRQLTIFALTIALLGLFAPAQAGQRGVLVSPAAGKAAGAAGVPNSAVIAGQVVYGDSSPVAFAQVHLRNIDSGAIMDQTTADHVGQFSFMVPGRGVYVAELFDQQGSVLAAGPAITVEAGQTVGVVVMLPTKIPTFAGLFGNSAASLVSAAAGAGITAVSSTGEPLSPEE